MREQFIKLNIEMDASTALRIARCLKSNEPKIYKVLVKEIKQALTIPIVSISAPIQEQQLNEDFVKTVNTIESKLKK